MPRWYQNMIIGMVVAAGYLALVDEVIPISHAKNRDDNLN